MTGNVIILALKHYVFQKFFHMMFYIFMFYIFVSVFFVFRAQSDEVGQIMLYKN